MFQMSSLVTHRPGLAALKVCHKILHIIQQKLGAFREVEYVVDIRYLINTGTSEHLLFIPH